MANENDMVRMLDRKIAEMEREIELIREAASRLPALEANLASVRQTRRIFAGDEQPAQSEAEQPAPTVQQDGHGGAATTILGMAAAILSAAGRPMHVSDICEAMKKQGRNVTVATLAGILFRAKDTGRGIAFKGKNIYAAEQGQPSWTKQ